MTDLTKITTPFGLLDYETREALKAHGGPYEMVGSAGAWIVVGDPAWSGGTTYRVKPQPPKPREWWMLRQICKDTEAEAIAFREECHRMSPELGFLDMPIIHVIEKLP